MSRTTIGMICVSLCLTAALVVMSQPRFSQAESSPVDGGPTYSPPTGGYGDFDADGDVDGDDVLYFESCATGPGVPQNAPNCVNADLDGDADVDQSDFGLIQRCHSGAGNPADPNCACSSGETSCSGTCTNPQSDNANCGVCGNVCPEGTTCLNGSCEACPAGTMLCGGACIDVMRDAFNCGSCGYQCNQDQYCAAGQCSSYCYNCQ